MLPCFILSGQAVDVPLQLFQVSLGSGGDDPQILNLCFQAAYSTLVVIDLIQQLAVLVRLYIQPAKWATVKVSFVSRSVELFKRGLSKSFDTCVWCVCVCVCVCVNVIGENIMEQCAYLVVNV